MTFSLEAIFHRDLNTLAYRISGTRILPVAIEPATNGKETNSFSFLMECGGFVAVPPRWRVDIGRPGLYRIFNCESRLGLQWIVHDSDVTLLAASVSSLFYHHAGEPDQPEAGMAERRRLAVQYALSTAVNQKVGGVCTTAAETFAAICKTVGLNAIVWEFRNVSTSASPFSTHAMTEVFDPATGNPVLFDIDRGLTLHRTDAVEEPPLSCEDFLTLSQCGENIAARRINKRSFAGFGPESRYKSCEDFPNDLFELGGAAFDRDFYRIIGASEIVFGRRPHVDQSWISLPVAKAAAIRVLEDETLALTAPDRQLLASITGFPDSDFARSGKTIG